MSPDQAVWGGLEEEDTRHPLCVTLLVMSLGIRTPAPACGVVPVCKGSVLA